MTRSRLRNSLEKQTKRNLYLSLFGIVVIIGLVITFGMPLLINYSLFMEKLKDGQDTEASTNSKVYVAPPILDQTFSATNSATLTISGTAQAKQAIKLYLNDELVEKIKTEDNGTFTFKTITLTDGENSIKAKALVEKSESNFSNELTIIYKNHAPSLTIDSPADNQIVSGDNNKVTVRGKTDTEVKVTVNGFWAIVSESGQYTYDLTLQNGDNQVKVQAIDQAGNKAEAERKVIYNH